MRILAIESSHDDTSVCVYEDKEIIKNWHFNQTKFHQQFGGTIPEFASRIHFSNFKKIYNEITNYNLPTFDYVAYTSHPGLIGSLNMGMIFAKTIAQNYKLNLVPINHLHGHLFAVEFTKRIQYPAIGLIVSGGHTQLWYLKSKFDLQVIGETKDDAAGEVFDKVARYLGLGFPGGPAIDKIYDSRKANIKLNVSFDDLFNFSFSGIKTQVKSIIEKNLYSKDEIASSFQKKMVEILISKTKKANAEFEPKSIILGGGVAANSLLRKEMKKEFKNALIPNLEYTTDSATMIAIACDVLKND